MNVSDQTIIAKPSLVESVREHLIRDIMERRYLPGQKLPVVEIASRYGVSETPVKQAFNRLVSEGMLIALPRRGVVVNRMSRDEVREIMEARQMIYVGTADAALETPEADRDKMRSRLMTNLQTHRALLDEVRQAQNRLTIDEYLRYVALDREYHSIYLECANNRTIERFFAQLNNLAYTFASAASFSAHMAKRVFQTYQDHHAILDAWWAGDRARMIDALKNHKEGAIATMHAILDGDNR